MQSRGQVSLEGAMNCVWPAAFRFAGNAFDHFICGLIQTATEEYIREFGRLPGSNKTKRLRKKRVQAVARYLWRRPKPKFSAWRCVSAAERPACYMGKPLEQTASIPLIDQMIDRRVMDILEGP